MKNFFFLAILLYFFVLFQTSFSPFFPSGSWWNLVLITVIFINLFEEQDKKLGLYSAFLGGFFLDIFSENFFGYWILILLTISIFIKFVLKRFFAIPAVIKEK